MNKFFKAVRIITIAPVMAFILITTLFLSFSEITSLDYALAIITIVIMPVMAYPIQRIFKIFKGDMRSGERKLAIVVSFTTYTIGFIYSLLFSVKGIYTALMMTYFLSGLLMVINTFVFSFDASGHMCGVSGPIAMLIYCFGWHYLYLLFILMLVFLASYKLKRHTVKQMVFGALIPILALLISVSVF